MKLFKMKSLERDGLLHVLDMMINDRIYLSTHHPMNDIEEGGWGYGSELNNQYLEAAKEVRAIVDKQRITSFVSSINNPLMWAHYAGGFSGIALEYDLDPNKLDIRKIEYTGRSKVSIQQLEQIFEGKILPQDAGILRTKDKCWEYEDEWRLYGNSEDEYLLSTKPKAMILGVKENLKGEVLIEIARKFGILIGYLNRTNGVDYDIIYVKLA